MKWIQRPFASPAIGAARNVKDGLRYDPSAPQQWAQKLQKQGNPNEIDRKNSDEAIDAKLFSDPPARRRNELRACNRYVCKGERCNNDARPAESTDRSVSTLRSQTNRIFFSGTCRARTNCIGLSSVFCDD